MPKDTITLPADLIPQFEAWGQMTAQLFGQLNRSLLVQRDVQTIPNSQQWYWTSQWQQWEQEADADIAAGRVKHFNTLADLITDLDGSDA